MAMRDGTVREPGHGGQRRYIHVDQADHQWVEVVHRGNREAPLRDKCPRCRGQAIRTTIRGRAAAGQAP